MEYASISDPWQGIILIGVVPSFLVFAYLVYTLGSIPKNKITKHLIMAGFAAFAGILFFAFGILQAVNSHNHMVLNSIENIEKKYDVDVIEDTVSGLNFNPMKKDEQLVFVKPNKDIPFYSTVKDATTGERIYVKSDGEYLLYSLTQNFDTGEPNLREVPLPDGSVIGLDPTELLK